MANKIFLSKGSMRVEIKINALNKSGFNLIRLLKENLDKLGKGH